MIYPWGFGAAAYCRRYPLFLYPTIDPCIGNIRALSSPSAPMLKRNLLLAASLLVTPNLYAQDVAVSRLGQDSNSNAADYNYYGTSGGKVAYSIATTSCNVGSVVIQWNPSARQAPAISTNMFRVYDNKIEMLGYSWLKDSFCAVSEPTCGSCQNTGCSTLGIGCADTYWAGLNDGANGVSKFELNPTTGEWPTSWSTASGSFPLRGRIQFPVSEAADPNSRYIAEAIYISEHDQMAGNARNNGSWREFQFNGGNVGSISNVGPVHMFDPAIFAWKEMHSDVHIDELVNTNEGGAGVHGYIFVASKATDIGGGFWRYDYAVQNFNSKQAVGSFNLPTMTCPIQNTGFHDVDYHSGSPWKNTDWSVSTAGNTPVWTTDTYAQDVNANAIRWGMMYNFSFESGAAPAATMGTATLGLFEPGVGTSLAADVIVPGDVCGGCSGGAITSYCTANGNSASPAGAQMSITGTPNVSANDLEFVVTGLPAGQFGYFLMAPSQGTINLGGGSQGFLCLGGAIVRWNDKVEYILNSGLFGFATLQPDLNDGPFGYQFLDGETWNFQFWYRDFNPGSTSNTSTAVEVEFCQ